MVPFRVKHQYGRWKMEVQRKILTLLLDTRYWLLKFQDHENLGGYWGPRGKMKGKRLNRVYPGQNATQQGTYLFTAGNGHS